MDQHEHRPTFWRYLNHLDSTNPKNWTGKHTLVCKECGEKITRVRFGGPDVLIWLLLFATLVLLRWCKAQDELYWMLLPFVPLGLTNYRRYRKTHFQLLSEYQANLAHLMAEDDAEAD